MGGEKREREKANDVSVSAANHKDGHVLNVSESGGIPKMCSSSKLIDAKLTISTSLHSGDETYM